MIGLLEPRPKRPWWVTALLAAIVSIAFISWKASLRLEWRSDEIILDLQAERTRR